MTLSEPQETAQRSAELDFEARTRIVFGAGQLESLGAHAARLGFRKTLLVSDRGIARAGHVDRAAQILSREGIDVVRFTGVEENPTTEHVDAGLSVAREHAIDSIVGLGGGSSMDCAKGINFLFSCGGRMADYRGVGKAGRPMLPMIAVPTTAGTGSETQSFALISDAATHDKMACGDRAASCKLALLDPELTLSQPAEVSAATGMDALSHAVESYVTRRRNAISQAFSLQAWRLLSGGFEDVLSQPGDIDARGRMLLGAALSGLAIENSMLGATHSLANPLTARYDIAHGVAIGLLLPHVVRYNAAVCEDAYAVLTSLDMAQGPLDEEAVGAAERPSGERLARRLESLRAAAGLPTRLGELGVEVDSLAAMAEMAATQWTAQFNPREVTAEDLEELYRCAL